MREPSTPASPVARAPSGAETPLRTLPIYLASSHKGGFGLLLGCLALIPIGVLGFTSLAFFGLRVALVVIIAPLLLLGAYYLRKLRSLEEQGRYSFFTNRVEWSGPALPGMKPFLEYPYADIGHIERTAWSIILRREPTDVTRMEISVRPEQLGPLLSQLVRLVTEARPEGALISVRHSQEQPPSYIPQGAEPLTYFPSERTVSGAFRIETRDLVWRVYAEGDPKPLVRVRQQEQSPNSDVTLQDIHWYLETPERALLAHLWPLHGNVAIRYELRGSRGEELGRLTLSGGFMSLHSAELISGTHRLTLVREGGEVRIALNGKPVIQLGGPGQPSKHHGQVTGALPYRTFVLAMAGAVILTR